MCADLLYKVKHIPKCSFYNIRRIFIDRLFIYAKTRVNRVEFLAITGEPFYDEDLNDMGIYYEPTYLSFE